MRLPSARMNDYGVKKVRFRKEGFIGVSDMLLQVSDVSKPLVSVTRILDKGNTAIFSKSQEVRSSSTTRLA